MIGGSITKLRATSLSSGVWSVVTNAAFSTVQDRSRSPVTSALIAEYKRAHENMLTAIQAMDELALEATPNQLKVSHTRLRITRAANESRGVLHIILSLLSQTPSPTIRSKVELLEQLHVELKEIARRHMAKWTHAAAQEDWQGFCHSHAHVGELWRETIQRERQLLYPIL
jgi:hypothetical protein